MTRGVHGLGWTGLRVKPKETINLWFCRFANQTKSYNIVDQTEPNLEIAVWSGLVYVFKCIVKKTNDVIVYSSIIYYPLLNGGGKQVPK